MAHRRNEEFLCVPCNRIFASHQALQDHLSNSQSHNFYCAPCNRQFNDDNSLRNHLASKRHQQDAYSSSDEDGEDFLCESCDRIFGSHQALQDHLSKSQNHNYCITCERDFKDENSLHNHLSAKHHQQGASPSPRFLCPACRSGFTSPAALAEHMEKSKCFRLNNESISKQVKDSKQSDSNSITITVNIQNGATNQSSVESNSEGSTSNRVSRSPSNLQNRATKQAFVEKNSQGSTSNRGSRSSSNLILEEKLKCFKCKSHFNPIKITNISAKKTDDDRYSYGCAICSKRFEALSSLSQHLDSNVHKPSDLRCSKCRR